MLQLLIALTSLSTLSSAWMVSTSWNQKIQQDLAALTRRVTARHVVVANEEIALALKRKIRKECMEKQYYVVDALDQAAKKYSQDETTNYRGGLIGELVPQGYCQSRILDQACFQVPLGSLEGPIQSEVGYHLLLVTERTNCPKLDGTKTKLVQTSPSDIFGTLVSTQQQAGAINIGEMMMNLLVYWVLTFLAAGVVAELAERIATPFVMGGDNS